MNKQELEKMFDEKYMNIFNYGGSIEKDEELKEFIFETIILEVLKSILPKYYEDCGLCSELKQKAKELYDINL